MNNKSEQSDEIQSNESLHSVDSLSHSPAVCLSNITVLRGGREVLHNIDLCVDQGVFLGIIGPNGGGKTTLLNVILGAIQPVAGHVEVFGGNPCSRKLRHLIGYVPQSQSIPEHFPATAYDVVLMGAYGVSGKFFPVKKEYRDHARHLLTQVRLENLTDRPIGKMSGGQQQRVFIARALVTRPRLLLLDEPLRGVDASGQSKFFDLLLELKNQYDLTVIMVSHDIHLITRFSERIACLNRTVHWHDRSEFMNPQVLSHTYQCELDAIFTQQLMEQSLQTPFKHSDPSLHDHE
jgi:zinc transport system ATP-binding protein